jgi:citrate lyase beta subunit
MKTTNVGGGHTGYLVRADPVDGAVAWARRVVETLRGGPGAAMVDGKVHDGSYKQCQKVLRFTKLVARRDAADHA